MSCFLLFHTGAHGYRRHPLGGINFLCETQERSRGLENVIRASIDIKVSNMWAKCRFCVDYPFKTHLHASLLTRKHTSSPFSGEVIPVWVRPHRETDITLEDYSGHTQTRTHKDTHMRGASSSTRLQRFLNRAAEYGRCGRGGERHSVTPAVWGAFVRELARQERSFAGVTGDSRAFDWRRRKRSACGVTAGHKRGHLHNSRRPPPPLHGALCTVTAGHAYCTSGGINTTVLASRCWVTD